MASISALLKRYKILVLPHDAEELPEQLLEEALGILAVHPQPRRSAQGEVSVMLAGCLANP
jgi:hypothetical protein